MTTLAEHIIVAGAENHPPMFEKSMYDSWASRIHLFIKGKKNGRMMLDSIDNGPLVYPTVEENEQTRPKKYSELTEAQQLQDDCDVQETNIIPYGLHPMITMQQVQVNTKFLNSLPPEWSKFVTDVKLAKSLYTTNYDQLYAYLSQHERHANEQRDDPIECINKAIVFLSVVASRFPPSNNQLRTSSNPINQATVQDGRVTVQQVQGRQTHGFVGTGNKGTASTSKGNYAAGQEKIVNCYNCLGEGYMAKQCTQPKRPRCSAWFKEKLILVKAQEAGQILDEDKIAFIADPKIAEVQVAQQIIP
nr:hypothetical protein [Tanacetum cinerariifolium]